MKLREAFEIVLELAEQNVIDFDDFPFESMRQRDAIALVGEAVKNIEKLALDGGPEPNW